ncbi:MAG: hypothetical protein AAFN77_23715 [Planctomycetota bacterium]
MADYKPDRPAFASKYTSGPPITGGTDEQLIQRVIEAAQTEATPPIAIPASDAMVLALVKHRDQLADHALMHPSLTSGLAAEVVDKQSFYQQCLDADVATPQTAFPEDVESLIRLGDQFQFPLLLKPVFGHLWRERLKGNKLLVAETQSEFIAMVESFGDDATGLMVQELIPGTEKNIWVGAVYRGTGGEHDCCFVGQKVRQYPPDFGSASYAKSQFVSEIAELSWKFLDAVDYRGICGTEFKYDARDGQYKMIEVNPRPTLWFHLVASSGVELLYQAYRDLAGDRIEVDTQREGVAWCFQDKDILTWWHHFKRLNFAPLWTTFAPWNHGAVIKWSDPMPALKIPFYYWRRIRERMFGAK